jgi:glycosyltransferase involved in cell wall biosynthesis
MIKTLKTIAFFTPQMTIGGAEMYIVNKSGWLLEKGYSVIVISAGGEWVNRLSPIVKHFVVDAMNIAPYRFSSNKLNRLIERLIEIININNIDIIEAHNTYPIIYALLVQKVQRVVVLLNVLSELSYQKCPLLCYATKGLAGYGLYFTLSESMNYFIQQKAHCAFPSCTIIPIPVLTNESLEIYRRKYILSVCRMSPEKMYIKYLMDDFFELINEKKIDKNFKLILVGDGVCFEEIKRKASTLNALLGEKKIILKGYCEGIELDKLYAECDIFVGMGTALLTGVLYGKPSIIAGFTPKTMPYAWGVWGIDDTAVGIGIPNTNQSRHQNIIKKILNDDKLYYEISEIAKKAALKKYSMDAVMLQWNQFYNQIYQTSISGTFFWLKPYIAILRLLYSMKVILQKYRIFRQV